MSEQCACGLLHCGEVAEYEGRLWAHENVRCSSVPGPAEEYIRTLKRERDEALARAERAEARAEKLHAALRMLAVGRSVVDRGTSAHSNERLSRLPRSPGSEAMTAGEAALREWDEDVATNGVEAAKPMAFYIDRAIAAAEARGLHKGRLQGYALADRIWVSGVEDAFLATPYEVLQAVLDEWPDSARIVGEMEAKT